MARDTYGAMSRVAFCALFAFALGCGGGDKPAADLGGTGGNAAADLAGPAATPDLGHAGDLAYLPPTDGGGFQCGNMTCGGGTRCCVQGTTPMCMTSCPDGGFIAECDGPEDCGGNPCCITINAGFSVGGVLCGASATDCPPAVDPNTQSGKDRACHVDGDCAAGAPGTMLPDCCTNSATGQHVCFNKSLVGLVPGWTCP